MARLLVVLLLQYCNLLFVVTLHLLHSLLLLSQLALQVLDNLLLVLDELIQVRDVAVQLADMVFELDALLHQLLSRIRLVAPVPLDRGQVLEGFLALLVRLQDLLQGGGEPPLDFLESRLELEALLLVLGFEVLDEPVLVGQNLLEVLDLLLL